MFHVELFSVNGYLYFLEKRTSVREKNICSSFFVQSVQKIALKKFIFCLDILCRRVIIVLSKGGRPQNIDSPTTDVGRKVVFMLNTNFASDATLWGMVVTLSRLESTRDGWFAALNKWMDEGASLESKESFQSGGRIYKLVLIFSKTGEVARIRFRDGIFCGAYVETADDYIVHVRPR